MWKAHAITVTAYVRAPGGGATTALIKAARHAHVNVELASNAFGFAHNLNVAGFQPSGQRRPT